MEILAKISFSCMSDNDRLKLEYAEVVWSPHEVKHTRNVERKGIATELVSEVKQVPYMERLEMHLITLGEGRERAHPILLYTLITQMGFEEASRSINIHRVLELRRAN